MWYSSIFGSKPRTIRHARKPSRLSIFPLEDRVVPSHTVAAFSARSGVSLSEKMTGLSSHQSAEHSGHGGTTPVAAGSRAETESPNSTSQNNTQTTAEFLPHFGTGSKDQSLSLIHI